MTFGQVLRRCAYGTTGYVTCPDDLDAVAAVVRHNLGVLRGFAQIVVATNYADHVLTEANHRMWRSFFPDVVMLDSEHNRGHSIGTADLENLLFEHCESTGIQWLCKGANDIVLTPEVTRIPVGEAQFYYLNAVAYAAVRQHGRDAFGHGFFYPQSTFFVIDVTATDYLYDRGLLDGSWATVSAIPDYTGRIWEYLPGWSCERWLRDCVLRNGLVREHLLTTTQWQHVVDIVIDQRIEDCSFKGLTLNGICHGWPDPAFADPESSCGSPAPPFRDQGSTPTRTPHA
jgi:hypothetical protein